MEWQLQNYMTKLTICTKLICSFYQLHNIIPKIKDSEKLYKKQQKLDIYIFVYKILIICSVCINFKLAIAELYDKRHYMYKIGLKLISIAQDYSKNLGFWEIFKKQQKLDIYLFVYKTHIFCSIYINFGLAIAELYYKSHYMYKIDL